MFFLCLRVSPRLTASSCLRDSHPKGFAPQVLPLAITPLANKVCSQFAKNLPLATFLNANCPLGAPKKTS